MFYSKILIKVLLPIGDFLFKSKYHKCLLEVDETLRLDSQEISKSQEGRLKSTLEYAIRNSSYYKKLGISLEQDIYKSLKKFPFLTKNIIRGQSQEILTRKNGLIKNSTSGSTGIQTEIYIDKDEQSLIRAIQTTWWKWAGYELGKPMLQTGLATSRTLEKRLKDYFFRIYYQFAFGLTNENTEIGLHWAKNKKPFLGGYASSLYVLANIAENRGIQMKSAISWGDKLFDHYKEKIKQVFGCNVYETYGTGEGLMLGAQKDLNLLYIMDPYFIVEILDDHGNEVNDGEIGHVVVTSLIHKVMPLIRYRVGDLAIKLPKDEYPAHRELNLSLFKKIIGRETDIVRTPSGNQLIVHSFTGVFEYFSEIKQFQVCQQKGHTNLLINYIPGNNFNSQILNVVHEKLNHLANEELPIIFTEVNLIPDTNSGKPQIVRIIP